MKELRFLEIIKQTLSNSAHIGDDCAYLKNLGIVVTQDTLVEDIHFSTQFSTPFQLASKALLVNISDVLASGAEPKYITISLSLPKNIEENFVKEFYQACDELANKFSIEVIGGDMTGAEKIFISVCAIGVAKDRKISSRSFAKTGDLIIVSGEHGTSAAGLVALQNSLSTFDEFIMNHLIPNLDVDFSITIAKNINRDYTMMDTSDGLADALFKIAKSSNKFLSVDFNKIPRAHNLQSFCDNNNLDIQDLILYGGEDYKLVACVDKEFLQTQNFEYTIIGEVFDCELESASLEVISGSTKKVITNLDKTFNHFKRN